jgi:hypothetical protein
MWQLLLLVLYWRHTERYDETQIPCDTRTALEEGIRRGYRRAYKHVENPTEESICEHIEEQVMSSLYEYFDFFVRVL